MKTSVKSEELNVNLDQVFWDSNEVKQDPQDSNSIIMQGVIPALQGKHNGSKFYYYSAPRDDENINSESTLEEIEASVKLWFNDQQWNELKIDPFEDNPDVVTKKTKSTIEGEVIEAERLAEEDAVKLAEKEERLAE